MTFSGNQTIQKLTRLLVAPTLEPSQRAARIQAVEKDVILPLRGIMIIILSYFLFFTGWSDATGNPRQYGLTCLRWYFLLYVSGSLAAAGVFVSRRQLTLPKVQWIVFGVGILDALLVIGLVFIVDGFDTQLWGLIPVLILHNALAIPAAMPQLLLNFTLVLSFIAGGMLDRVLIANPDLDNAPITLNSGDLLSPAQHPARVGPTSNAAVELASNRVASNAAPRIATNSPVRTPEAETRSENASTNNQSHTNIAGRAESGEPAGTDWDRVARLKKALRPAAETRTESPLERIIVLIVWTACCYGIQVLFEKQRHAEVEATEFAVRQERLRTAGRLAAEIAHKIKNPLGIITNAAFCLQRAVNDGEFDVEEQIVIIREEVARADQILTELMGYAQLAEGRVERLDVAAEVDDAILQVFPPGAKYEIAIKRYYASDLPSMLMQRQHLSSVLVNLLQNAREALNGVGEIEVTTRYGEHDSIVISIADNGPGIEPDKLDKIFEAYFTTRIKGTGLGLAIVKHNTEMYGGAVKVQSELGVGTRFTLEFPARILMRVTA